MDTIKEVLEVLAPSQESIHISTNPENPTSSKSDEFEVDSEFAQQMLQAEFVREHAILAMKQQFKNMLLETLNTMTEN